MRTPQSALYAKGTTLRCPVCHRTIVTTTGTEITAICHDRHRATRMQPVTDADSHEKRTA